MYLQHLIKMNENINMNENSGPLKSGPLNLT